MAVAAQVEDTVDTAGSFKISYVRTIINLGEGPRGGGGWKGSHLLTLQVPGP